MGAPRLLVDAPRLLLAPAAEMAGKRIAASSGDSSSTSPDKVMGAEDITDQQDAALEKLVGELGLLLLPADMQEAPDLEQNVCAALQGFLSSGRHAAAVARGWTPETDGPLGRHSPLDAAGARLARGHSVEEGPRSACYGGLVVEGSVGAALLDALPGAAALLQPPASSARPTSALWAFFGSNASEQALVGKPEHVDELRPGLVTMHAQLCGEKVWRLRPNPAAFSGGDVAAAMELNGFAGEASSSSSAPLDDGLAVAGVGPRRLSAPPRILCHGGRLQVRCRAGDRLIIDTGAWYHETSLPPRTPFSLSVARDYAFGSAALLDVSSSQMFVRRQLCALCQTPTATPPGAPPGTCGCVCCEAKRRERAEWEVLRRSSALAQRYLSRRHGSVAQGLLLEVGTASCSLRCGGGFGAVCRAPMPRRPWRPDLGHGGARFALALCDGAS